MTRIASRISSRISSRSRRPGPPPPRAHGGAGSPSPAGRPSPSRRRGPAPDRHLRLALWTTAVLTVGTIFGAAIFHVLLVQSQFQLDRLSEQAAAEQHRYEKLRLELARLASPERVVAVAQERLGMVAPDEVSYLMAPAPAGAEDGPDLAGDWSEVKPHFAARR